LGYAPTTNIEVGLREFVAWYQGYYKGAPGWCPM
jgi:hypothetical protein